MDDDWFDPDDWTTWPIPYRFITGLENGRVTALSPRGYDWCDGFEAGWKAAEERLTNGDVL